MAYRKHASMGRLFRQIVLASIQVPAMGAVWSCGSRDGATALAGGGEGGASGGAGGDSAGAAGVFAGRGGANLAGAAGALIGAGGSAGAAGAMAGGSGAGQGGTAQPDTCNGVGPGSCGGFCVTVPDGVTLVPPLSPTQCYSFCNTTGSCTLVEPDVATQPRRVRCQMSCLTGRRTDGACNDDRVEGSDLGAYYARLAYLEAASVPAFSRLADELRHHGAPPSLIRSAERAARDEIRHAALATALAEKHGTPVPRPDVGGGPVRSLEEVATENAIEGCVRETFGALLATHQMNAARDPEARALFTRLAHDETEHAELAWRVARWTEERLDEAARMRVRASRRAAARDLALEAIVEPVDAWAKDIGIPDARTARHLVERLAASLWS